MVFWIYIDKSTAESDSYHNVVVDVVGLNLVEQLADVVMSSRVPAKGELDEGLEADADCVVPILRSHICFGGVLEDNKSITYKVKSPIAMSISKRDGLVDSVQTAGEDGVRNVGDLGSH